MQNTHADTYKTLYPILKTFSRGLSHKIRTPLSVISNELSYLASENNEILSLKRCNDIADILSQIQLPNDGDLQTYSVDNFLEKISYKKIGSNKSVTLSPRLINFSFSLIKNLTLEYNLEISTQNDSLLFIFTTPLTNSATEREFKSFTSFFCEQLGWTEYTPILIDTVLFYQNLNISILNGTNHLTITLRAPLI